MTVAELILKYVEALVWPSVVLIFLYRFRRGIGELIARTRSLATPAGSIEFTERAGELLDDAATDQEERVPTTARRGVLRRLERSAESLQDGKILWADDRPRNNIALVRLFESMGMQVDLALSTEEGLERLEVRSYHIVITDLERDGDEDAGNTLIKRMSERGIDVPVVIYSGSSRLRAQADRRAFATTTGPDRLIHYVIDLMERARFA
ncbi:response regulator [Streptomyces sp. DG2A-72]|uniref:response regulator n=1 Tax=Streptomyces sp. DG2A-72 TaxID=3051386 RepID=UPI00265C3B1E|nr:response regulator [Streptomyces sp. DG2A-72]MDO0934148.1 response regulator [Streptomyces sp. DG2A-72]